MYRLVSAFSNASLFKLIDVCPFTSKAVAIPLKIVGDLLISGEFVSLVHTILSARTKRSPVKSRISRYRCYSAKGNQLRLLNKKIEVVGSFPLTNIENKQAFHQALYNGSSVYKQSPNLGTLFQAGINIKRKNRKHSTIHCHGHEHLVQRNTIEENLHVFQ